MNEKDICISDTNTLYNWKFYGCMKQKMVIHIQLYVLATRSASHG